MIMRTAAILLHVISCAYAVSVPLANEPAPAPNSTLDYLDRALKGLELAMDFFQREYTHVNLDGVIGTRIVEASFKVLLQRLDASDLITKVPPSVISRITRLHGEFRDVSDSATPHIHENEPDYYAHIGPIIAEGLFELDYESRDVSRTVIIWPYNPEEVMDETDSDNCLAELFGTTDGMTCAISNHCWTLMTTTGYSRYSLSHQIFYLEIAERFGCQLEMQWQIAEHKQSSLRRLHDIFCANMLGEANLIAGNGLHKFFQDLFMEQAALCGMLGFRDFFNSQWLDKILSWQDSTLGCYKWADWPASDSDGLAPLDGPKYVKREEKRLDDGCLSHRTAVAVGALSQYVRYIIEVWFQEQI